MVPEDSFNNHLIGTLCLYFNSRLAAFIAPQSSEHPPVSVTVGRIRSYEVASPNALVAPVADVTRPNSVKRLCRIRPTHSSLTSAWGFGSSNPSL